MYKYKRHSKCRKSFCKQKSSKYKILENHRIISRFITAKHDRCSIELINTFFDCLIFSIFSASLLSRLYNLLFVHLGAVIVLALSILAPYFFYIPKATLAAILIVAACSLFDYKIFPTLWRCSSKLLENICQIRNYH